MGAFKSRAVVCWKWLSMGCRFIMQLERVTCRLYHGVMNMAVPWVKQHVQLRRKMAICMSYNGVVRMDVRGMKPQWLMPRKMVIGEWWNGVATIHEERNTHNDAIQKMAGSQRYEDNFVNDNTSINLWEIKVLFIIKVSQHNMIVKSFLCSLAVDLWGSYKFCVRQPAVLFFHISHFNSKISQPS